MNESRTLPRRLTPGELTLVQVGSRVEAFFWEGGVVAGRVIERDKTAIVVELDGMGEMVFRGDGSLDCQPRHYLCGGQDGQRNQ